MHKIIPNGPVIKKLRDELERLSTQKEMAAEIGVSERKYRDIENANLPVERRTFGRLAKTLNVRPEQITFEADPPVPLAPPSPPADGAVASILDQVGWNRERLIPRFDEDIASSTMDEAALYSDASMAQDVESLIRVSLNDETGEYVEELYDLLNSRSLVVRGYGVDISSGEEIRLRRRIRQLLMLLKGNDIWVYQTMLMRCLPERFTPAPKDQHFDISFRLMIAFGPPGEYGETTLRVPVDHGQPFILPTIDEIVGRKKVAA